MTFTRLWGYGDTPRWWDAVPYLYISVIVSRFDLLRGDISGNPNENGNTGVDVGAYCPIIRVGSVSIQFH